ncbi:MAG: hypothetical protein V3T70_03360, partial [Phycisphaerae bacterium]
MNQSIQSNGSIRSWIAALAAAIVLAWSPATPSATWSAVADEPPPSTQPAQEESDSDANSNGKADNDAELARLREMAIASTQPKSTTQPESIKGKSVTPDMTRWKAPTVTGSGVRPPKSRGPSRKTTPEAQTPPSATQPVTDAAATAPALEALLAEAPLDPESLTYRFDYFETQWSNVLEDFARRSGLSLVGDLAGLNGVLSYRSPKESTFDEAVYQINELLLARPLDKFLMKREGLTLRLKRLPDWLRDIPVERMFHSFDAYDKAELNDHEIAAVMYDVPAGWTAPQIIDRFRPMFADVFYIGIMG